MTCYRCKTTIQSTGLPKNWEMLFGIGHNRYPFCDKCKDHCYDNLRYTISADNSKIIQFYIEQPGLLGLPDNMFRDIEGNIYKDRVIFRNFEDAKTTIINARKLMIAGAKDYLNGLESEALISSVKDQISIMEAELERVLRLKDETKNKDIRTLYASHPKIGRSILKGEL